MAPSDNTVPARDLAKARSLLKDAGQEHPTERNDIIDRGQQSAGAISERGRPRPLPVWGIAYFEPTVSPSGLGCPWRNSGSTVIRWLPRSATA